MLNEVIYPSSLSPRPFISAKAELYLETSYIHIGERLYDDAFKCLEKAKQLIDSNTLSLDFYFLLHTAQIYDSAGRDEAALLFYHKAKGKPFTTQKCYNPYLQPKAASGLLPISAWALPSSTSKNISIHSGASRKQEVSMA